MEWFVEEPSPYDNEQRWIESGIGVSGDSGAAILDSETHGLYGHLWGRNEDKVHRTVSRVTYFTPIDDIFDDIQEKVSGAIRPRLPNQLEVFYPASSAPICPRCRLQDPVWREERTILPEAETPGIDITLEEENSYGRMTPMREMMASTEMTPQDEEVITPEDIRSPDIQRQRKILFEHTGLSCPSPYGDLSQSPYSNLLELSGAGMAESFAYEEFDIDSDEVERFSSGSGLERKRTANMAEVDSGNLEMKKQKVG
jgi:hypothetical protein